ncbi:MAG: ABC transporter ATP-binding protein [Promethearchaeota archaeon]
MTKNIIETKNLTKYYTLKKKGEIIKALDTVNISVKEGEVFGLIGPNGAGKTTMIHVLTTLKQPTRGTAFIDGYDILKHPKKVKKRIALMLENSMLYYRITAYDNLKFFCKFYEVPNYKEKIKQMAKEFGLLKWLDEYVENFSSGMKMKLAFCRTLLLDRKILFLDEPTSGIDINSKIFIVNKIKTLNNTIFLTSHDLGIVEELCNRVAIINKGKILKVGSKNEILNMIKKLIELEIKVSKREEELKRELEDKEYIETITEKNNSLFICLKNRKNFSNLLKILSNYDIQKITEKSYSLEKIFSELIK